MTTTDLPTITPVATVTHDTVLAVAGLRRASRQRLVTLSGYGAQYRDYDGPDGPAKYAEALDRNRRDYPGGPIKHRHNGAVWLSAESVVIAAKQYHAALAAEYAKDVPVALGDVIRVKSDTPGEGGLYRVEAPGRMDGDHARLVPVDATGVSL